MENALFYLFSAIAVVSAAFVVTHKNPLISALSLVLTLISSSVLFLLLSAQFVAIIQILVYAGAIIVLFLFTIMLLRLREEALLFDSQKRGLKVLLLGVLIVLTAFVSLSLFKRAPHLNVLESLPQGFGTIEGVSMLLFRDFLLPFELTSILIVVAILGVVAIAKRRAD